MPRGLIALWAACAAAGLIVWLASGWRLERERAELYAGIVAHCANDGAFVIARTIVDCERTDVW